MEGLKVDQKIFTTVNATDKVDAVKREAAWALITGLYYGSDIGIGEAVIRNLLGDYGLSGADLLLTLQGLEKLGFCNVYKYQEKPWAVITDSGKDLFDYVCDCPESIARPSKKYYAEI